MLHCHRWSHSVCKIFFFFFFSFDLSHTSLISSCLLLKLNYSHNLISPLKSFRLLLLSRSHLSDLELSHLSVTSHLHFSSFFFPLNVRISGSHLTIFLFFCALSHIKFLPNPNPTEQLVVFPSQS